MSINEISIPLPSGINLHTLVSAATDSLNVPTLLLIHFWGGSNRTYRSLITQISGRFNTIAPSLRGWGESSKPTDDNAYRIPDHVEDIVSLIKHLQMLRSELLTNGVVLVGHSMGAKIAQVLLAQPELMNLVRGVLHIGPAPCGSFRLDDEMRKQQIHAYEAIESVKFVIENVLLGNPTAVDAEEIGALAADAVAGSEGARKAWPAYGMEEDYEDIVTTAIRNYKKSRNKALPVAIVVGELDRVETPENARKRVSDVLAKAGAEVQTQTLEDIGHLVPVEAVSALSVVVRDFVGGL